MIAIHQQNHSFSSEWILYCQVNNLPYKLVNCHSSDIIDQLKHCSCLMWHYSHLSPIDIVMAKSLMYAIEQAGIKIFPNFNTAWHFDDKVGQKYLLEAINAPIVPTWVFYDKQEALNWIKDTQFPKVFKLRGGAGSQNVKLAKSKKNAISFVNKAFNNGFSNYDKWGSLIERVRKWKKGMVSIKEPFKGVVRLLFPPVYSKVMGREFGYLYFQEFMPNNNFDIRVIVIDNKAFAIKRMVRENDFRASGSGMIKYAKEEFDERCIQIAFEVTNNLKAQCIAFDFIFDKINNPLIVEISYGFAMHGYYDCPGYWDSTLKWHEGKFNPYGWMIDALINEN